MPSGKLWLSKKFSCLPSQAHLVRASWAGVIGAIAFPLMVGNASAERVIRVTDGDSIIVDSAGNEVNVRVADIDAPEIDQPYGEEAKDALVALVGARNVRLELVSGDAYRRIIANVYVEDRDVAADLVGQGFAWVRRAYHPAPELIRLEESARKAGRGLWADPESIPPWIWRKTRGNSATGKPLPTSPLPAVECSEKSSCQEMNSCEEAIAYLHQCGLKNIDGDNDGIPCEALCKYYR
jgi:endonuclease YncB( thermonuclease family)